MAINRKNILCLHFEDNLAINLNGAGSILTKIEVQELIVELTRCLDFMNENNITDLDIIKENKEMQQDFIDSLQMGAGKIGSIPVKKDHLYLIRNTVTGNVKIGRSINPVARLKQLNIASEDKLELIKVSENNGYLEEETHAIFSHLRLNSEWFKYEYSIIEYFNKTVQK